jgi:hypothetical protein
MNPFWKILELDLVVKIDTSCPTEYLAWKEVLQPTKIKTI